MTPSLTSRGARSGTAPRGRPDPGVRHVPLERRLTPMPGGESGYTGTPDVRHTGTPTTSLTTRPGHHRLAPEVWRVHHRRRRGPAGGKQGVVRSRSGDEVTVQIGTLKTLPKRRDAWRAWRARRTVSEAELELAKPQKKDKIIVVEGWTAGWAPAHRRRQRGRRHQEWTPLRRFPYTESAPWLAF